VVLRRLTWSAGFTQAAANPAAFANSCYNLVNDARWAGVFDGIDIDWNTRTPAGSSATAAGRPVQEPDGRPAGQVRLERAGHLGITADGTANGKIDAADYAGAAQYVNWYMPMTYDYFGAFTPAGPTAPHSPLTSYAGIPTPASTPTRRSRNSRRRGYPRASCCSASASTDVAGRV